MKEADDFRLSTERARILLGLGHDPIKGSRPGFEVFMAKGTVGDSLYRRMEDADRQLAQSSQRSPIAGWDIGDLYRFGNRRGATLRIAARRRECSRRGIRNLVHRWNVERELCLSARY